MYAPRSLDIVPKNLHDVSNKIIAIKQFRCHFLVQQFVRTMQSGLESGFSRAKFLNFDYTMTFFFLYELTTLRTFEIRIPFLFRMILRLDIIFRRQNHEVLCFNKLLKHRNTGLYYCVILLYR